MLEQRDVEYEYREYTEDPLDAGELERLFAALKLRPAELLRERDARRLGVTGEESDAELVTLMAEHPTLLQRPIGVKGRKAVVGRPPEAVLGLA